MSTLQRIPTRDDLGHRFGRHVEHDPASRRYAFPSPARLTRVTKIWPTLAPVLDQGDHNSCTATSAEQLLDTDFFAPVRQKLNKGRYFTQSDAMALYSLATQLDEFPGQFPPIDEGSSGLGVAKALKRKGLIDRYDHTFTWTQFRAAIATQPVLVGTVWTEKMMTPDAKGVVKVGKLTDYTIVGGHEYLCRGIDYTGSGWVVCRNSWGGQWGKNGEMRLSFYDFQKLLEAEGDVLVPHGVGL